MNTVEDYDEQPDHCQHCYDDGVADERARCIKVLEALRDDNRSQVGKQWLATAIAALSEAATPPVASSPVGGGRPTSRAESPLRQQIAEAIHPMLCDDGCSEMLHPLLRAAHVQRLYRAADAVLALLNLTEEHGTMLGNDDLTVIDSYRYVTPWLPTPPDAGSSEAT